MGICLMFFLDDKSKVQEFAEALKAEGVDAAGVFNSGIPDWHIYAHWKHVIEKDSYNGRLSVQLPISQGRNC